MNRTLRVCYQIGKHHADTAIANAIFNSYNYAVSSRVSNHQFVGGHATANVVKSYLNAATGKRINCTLGSSNHFADR